jgi:S1-C subfamily serine protease
MVSQFARNPPGGAAVAAGSAVLPSSQQQQQMASLYREKYHEPRLVYPIMKKSGDLGVRLVGGNAVGIFIHSVDVDSPAYNIGLRSADQILEYNGTDLR